jgi:hypothetical protein
MLQKVYPEHEWVTWKFKWHVQMKPSPEVMKEVLEYIESDQKITKLEDWYKVSGKTLLTKGAFGVISRAGGLLQTLKTYRPNFEWDEEKFIGFRHLRRTADDSL